MRLGSPRGCPSKAKRCEFNPYTGRNVGGFGPPFFEVSDMNEETRFGETFDEMLKSVGAKGTFYTSDPSEPGTALVFEGFRCDRCGELHRYAKRPIRRIMWALAIREGAKQAPHSAFYTTGCKVNRN